MNKPLILVVEDDAPIRNLITTTLKTQDYKYIAAATASEALQQATIHAPDVMLLDLGLPDLDGIEVIRRIRSWSAMPIIVISARSEDSDKIEALDSGADDYVAKPFGTMELISRIKALLRRTTSQETKEYEVGGLYVNTSKHIVRVNGNEVQLTFKEFELLCYLLENIGTVLSREKIITKVWGYDFDGESRTVDVHIRTLRMKLGDCGGMIETVRGIGYKAVDETNFRRSVHRFAGRYNFCCCNGARRSLHEGAAAFQEAA